LVVFGRGTHYCAEAIDAAGIKRAENSSILGNIFIL
jgi:hypothetical protein